MTSSQGRFAGLGVHRPVDVLQGRGHGFAVFPGDKVQRMAQQMNDAGLHQGFGEHGADGIGEAFQPVDHG